MATFTTLSAGGNTQDKTWGNEIILSYSEHRQVLGDSAVSAVSGGDDAQDKTLWLAMQVWLEANCTGFVNHTDEPNLYADVAAWRAVAGLNASGFSRYKDEALLGYGNMQNGDDRAVVNFQELQKGFDALRWTRDTITWTAKGEDSGWNGGSTAFASWADAKTDAEGDWQALGPTAYPSAESNGFFNIGPSYFANLIRSYAYAQASGLSTVVQHSAELWIRGKKRVPAAGDNYTFSAHGDDISETLEEQYTLAESGASSREQKVGDVSSRPSWCDTPDAVDTVKYLGYELDQSVGLWLLKWNGANGFSYTL